MAKFKGEGRLCDSMGNVKVEFVEGVVVTDDEDTIRFLRGKGYEPEQAVISSKKGVTNGV